MTNRTLSLAVATLVAALAATAVPATLHAQDEGDAAAEQGQNLVAELQQIQGQLMQIREKAMEDPNLQERQAVLQDRITSAMKDADPEVEAKMERVNEIQQEMREAQQAGEQEQVGTLMQEAQRLQQELQQTQSRVMQQEGVEKAVDEFREQLFDRMREIDPEADGLIERAQEIQAELQEQGIGS